MPSLAALHECPCALAQLYNGGEITMENESTLDNSGDVLTIIADPPHISAAPDIAPALTVTCDAPTITRVVCPKACLHIMQFGCAIWYLMGLVFDQLSRYDIN